MPSEIKPRGDKLHGMVISEFRCPCCGSRSWWPLVERFVYRSLSRSRPIIVVRRIQETHVRRKIRQFPVVDMDASYEPYQMDECATCGTVVTG
jgi:hypothetical protein